MFLPFLTSWIVRGALGVALLAQHPEPAAVPLVQKSASPTRLPGLRWGDYDQDGLSDAFLTSELQQVRVLRNLGDGRLLDVTLDVGLDAVPARAAHPADLDRDGHLDLLVHTPSGRLRLFEGLGTTFRERVPVSAFEDVRGVRQAAWIDYDHDGWLDLAIEEDGGAAFVLHNAGALGFERFDLSDPTFAPSAPDTRPFAVEPSATAPGNFPSPVSSGEERAPIASERVRSSPSSVGTKPKAFPGSSSTGSSSELPLPPLCADSIRDTAAPGNCFTASSLPSLGSLYPLSIDFHVTPAGRVGIGTPIPTSKVHVAGGNVRIDNGDLHLFDNGVRTVGLERRNGTSGSRMLFFNRAGAPTLELDSDNAGHGALALRNRLGKRTLRLESNATDDGAELFLGNSAGDTTISLDAETGVGGVYSGFNDAGAKTVELATDVGAGVGRLTLRDDSGATRVNLSAGPFDQGGELLLSAADGSGTVFLDGEAANRGGLVSVRNENTQPTIELLGDTGPSDGGRLTLFDRVNGTSSVVINGIDAAGTGSDLVLRGPSGNIGVDLDASNAGVAELGLYEDDGSLAFRFFRDELVLYKSSGAASITFNRQSGAKNAVVETENYGPRLLYAIEATEVWFEDFGGGRLTNGRCEVRLDPVFLETVTIDPEHPLQVSVTPTADCAGLFVQKRHDGFSVVEGRGGRSNASFDWRVAAKRKGLEDARLEPFSDRPRDSFERDPNPTQSR